MENINSIIEKPKRERRVFQKYKNKRDSYRDVVIEAHARLGSTEKVGEEIGLNKKTVKKILYEAGVSIKKQPMDLHGRVFGKLRCIRVFNKDKSNKIRWMCSCECGKYKIVRTNDLMSGKIKSCGCYKKYINSIVGLESIGKGPCQTGKRSPFKSYLKTILRGAINRNIEISINQEDLENSFKANGGICALSGVGIVMASAQFRTASLDRIDSQKGYHLDNIQWVSKHLNVMKLDWEQKEFIQACETISKFQNINKQNSIEYHI